MNKTPAIFNWSGGKDSALALYKTLLEEQYDVQYLITSVSEELQRVSMHGIRNELLYRQTEAIGIPMRTIRLPEVANIEIYNQTVNDCLQFFVNKGITSGMFGDIFLEDLRKYREEQLQKIGMKAIFPLWKKDTQKLANEFINMGFKTIITCVDESKLDKSFVGRVFDESFIADLPVNVDSCGEYGEFHTFVFDGPIFKKAITFTKGEIVRKTYPNHGKDQQGESGFWFIDLIPN